MEVTSSLARSRVDALQIARGVLVSVTGLTLYVAGGFTIPGESQDARALVWGAAMVASFAGWGTALARVAGKREEIDWGLRAAWGMALVLGLGSLVVALGVAREPVLRVTVGIGIGILCADAFWTERRARAPAGLGWYLCVLIVLCLLFLTGVASLTDRGQWWLFDDTPAYLVLPKQLLELGDMIQPFSFRRMSAYGGQSFLQALLLVGAAPEQVHLFDRGVCTALVVAVFLGTPEAEATDGRRTVPFPLRFLAAALVILLPNYRMNIGAVTSGTVVLFALYRTLDLPAHLLGSPRVRAAILGLLVAAACALRPFFVIPAVLCVAIVLVRRKDLRGEAPLRLEAARVAAASGLALVGWSIALVRSNGTPLFPPFSGYYQPASDFTHLVLGYERWHMVWEELRYWEPIATIHLFFVAGLVALETDTPAYRASYVALLVGFLVMVTTIPISAYRDLCRYALPLELAFVLIVFSRSLSAMALRMDMASTVCAFLVLAAACGELYWKHEEIQTHYDDVFSQAHDLVTGKELSPHIGRMLADPAEFETFMELPGSSTFGAPNYVDLQDAVPPGAEVAAMLDEPYRFDFKRNRITILDFPGVVGPGEGIPVFAGADRMAEYFLSLHIRYLAFVDPARTSGLYGMTTWMDHARLKRVSPQNFIAPRVLDILKNCEQLAVSRRTLYRDGLLILVDLAAPTGGN